MASWIWMKGVEVVLADPPIKPVNEHDKRKPVKDLIAKHREAIDQVKHAISNDDHYDPNKHDDLWCLRFVLSHKKKLKDAIKAAKHTLAFRAEHKLDETDIRYTPVDRNTPNEQIQAFLAYCTDDFLVFTLPDPKRGVVGFFNVNGVDQQSPMGLLPISNQRIGIQCFGGPQNGNSSGSIT